jgi:hypothetical protein
VKPEMIIFFHPLVYQLKNILDGEIGVVKKVELPVHIFEAKSKNQVKELIT